LTEVVVAGGDPIDAGGVNGVDLAGGLQVCGQSK
jgi:hypothetical protein